MKNDKKRVKYSIILIITMLIISVISIILITVAGKILDFVPNAFWTNFKYAMALDFAHQHLEAAAVVLYFVIMFFIIMWCINIALFVINKEVAPDKNVLIIAFLFSLFFLFPLSFFFYLFVVLDFIRDDIELKRVRSFQELEIPKNATFNFEEVEEEYMAIAEPVQLRQRHEMRGIIQGADVYVHKQNRKHKHGSLKETVISKVTPKKHRRKADLPPQNPSEE